MQNDIKTANPDERPGSFIHPSFHPGVIKILAKAGWIKTGETFLDESTHKAGMRIDLTKAGGERFRAALLLIQELDAQNLKEGHPTALNPHEVALVFRLARTYAPDQDNLVWPYELPPLTE